VIAANVHQLFFGVFLLLQRKLTARLDNSKQAFRRAQSLLRSLVSFHSPQCKECMRLNLFEALLPSIAHGYGTMVA
jgi:hypothetical protein